MSKKSRKSKRSTGDGGLVRETIRASPKSVKGITGIQRGSPAMAPEQLVTLRYCQQISIDPAGEAAPYSFRANSPFAPDVAGSLGTPHQPMGWDQWTAFYNTYVCFASRIRVINFPNSTTATTGAGFIGVLLSDLSSSAVVSIEPFIEDGKTRFKPFGCTGAAPVVLRHSFSLRKQTGVMDPRDQLGTIWGANVTTNPADPWFFIVWVGAAGDASNMTAQPLTIIIEYDVLFSEQKNLGQS